MTTLTCCTASINRIYNSSCNCKTGASGLNCIICTALNCTNCNDNGCTSCDNQNGVLKLINIVSTCV